MSIIDKIESITISRNAIRTKMVSAGQATRNDKLATLASNLNIPNTSDATASASDITEGKTAYVQGEKITGTSTKDADTSDATATADDILEGKTAYSNGVKLTGTATAGIDTSDATAVAGDILSGKTAYVDGAKVSGTITSKSAQTYTPGTTAQTIASGQYLSGAQTIAGDADLVASNIKKDVSIFGVTGAYQGTDTSDATATADKILKGYTAYVNGIKLIGTYEVPLSPSNLKSFSTASDTEITQMLTWLREGTITYNDLVSAGWTVGAERPVHLSAMSATGVGESHVAQDQTWVILHGKDFFDLANGGKNMFVVGLKNMLAEVGYINSSLSNSDGWNSCNRRTWCNNVFKNAIPSEELNWFKQFKVKASNGSKSTSITTSTDLFSLPSRAEVFGGSNTTYTPDTEGTSVLSYYSTSANRIKKTGDSGSADSYWLRSPSVKDSTGFCIVISYGMLTSNSANGTKGISPFGCL